MFLLFREYIHEIDNGRLKISQVQCERVTRTKYNLKKVPLLNITHCPKMDKEDKKKEGKCL